MSFWWSLIFLTKALTCILLLCLLILYIYISFPNIYSSIFLHFVLHVGMHTCRDIIPSTHLNYFTAIIAFFLDWRTQPFCTVMKHFTWVAQGLLTCFFFSVKLSLWSNLTYTAFCFVKTIISKYQEHIQILCTLFHLYLKNAIN